MVTCVGGIPILFLAFRVVFPSSQIQLTQPIFGASPEPAWNVAALFNLGAADGKKDLLETSRIRTKIPSSTFILVCASEMCVVDLIFDGEQIRLVVCIGCRRF